MPPIGSESGSEKFREKFITGIVLFIFCLATLPGLLSLVIFPEVLLFPYFKSNGLAPSAGDFDRFILEWLVPSRQNVPIEIFTLIVSAAPIAFLQSVYVKGSENTLSYAGKISTFILLIGFIVNFFGGLFIDPSSAKLIDNYANQETLSQFRGMTNQAAYFCLFYFLVLLSLRPKT